METVFLRLLSVPIPGGLETNVNFDIAPPAEAVGLPVVGIAALGGLVVMVVIVSFQVIRKIKKNRAGKEHS